jgi:endonuclease/exonuclease/phosphatase (EEP) superfamily protein YafD
MQPPQSPATIVRCRLDALPRNVYGVAPVKIPANRSWARITALLLAVLAAACAAALLAPLGWPFELFAHFRWQLGAAALVLLLIAAQLRRRGMVLLAAAALLSQVIPALWPVLQTKPAHAAGTCDGPTLRIATVNLWYANDDHRRLLAWLAANEPDLVALQEVTPAWIDALAVTQPAYPYRELLARNDPYGIGVLSRLPLRQVTALDLAGDGLPSLQVTADLAGQPLQLLGLHTHWPVTPGLQQARDRVLQQAAALARGQPSASIVLGDLNLTPYAPAFTRLVQSSGLRDALDDRAWRPTWQGSFWPLALPIDHVLVPRAGCVLDASIGPDIGSDHRPVLVTLRLPQRTDHSSR